LGNLQDIRTLDLDNNNLTGTIPGTFSNLTNLFKFKINNNDLSGCFHPELFQTLCSFRNYQISDGNNFDADWEDGCNCNAGACTACGDLNIWIGGSGMWNNNQSWSLDHTPLACEAVLIEGSNSVVTFPEFYDASIYTIEIKDNAELIIPVNSELHVLTDVKWVSLSNCSD